MAGQELIAVLVGYRRPSSPLYEHHFKGLPQAVLQKRNVPALLALLQDAKLPPRVREHAAGALGELGDTRAVNPLIQALGETRVRRGAAVALGRMQAKEAARPLRELAPRLPAARWALSQLGMRASVQDVLEDLRSGHLRLIGPKIKRLRAAQARAVSEEVCRELRQILSQNALDTSHRWLVTTLQFLAPPEAGDLLAQALRANWRRRLCPSVVTRLLRAVSAIRPPQVLPVLLEIARHADYPYHRRLAAACLRRIPKAA